MSRLNLTNGIRPEYDRSSLTDIIRQLEQRANALSEGGTVSLTTAVPTTSGTSVDIPGVPSWAKRVVVLLVGVSTNGTSNIILQIGSNSGGIESSGYLGSSTLLSGGAVTSANFTAGFGVCVSPAAATTLHGRIVLELESLANNTWVCAVNAGASDGAANMLGAGSKSLSSTLGKLRLTTAGGVNTFDTGEATVTYE